MNQPILKRLKHLLFATTLVALSFWSCETSDGDIPKTQEIDLVGIWESNENSEIFFAVGIIENENSDRIIACDASDGGFGCLIGVVKNDSIFLDNLSNIIFIAEPAGEKIRINASITNNSTFNGLFSKSDWPEGKCGLYNMSDGIIGIDENCIVGEWYSRITDPFGGPSELVYKTYFPDGSGELIYPERDKKISFSWNTFASGDAELINEYNYSDVTISDKEFAFICTDQGLGLGVSGGSWIRKNILCFVD